MSLSSNIRAGRAYVEVTAETSKLQRNLTSAQAQLQNFGRTCTNVGKDLLMLSGAMAAPLVMAARSFAGFDDSMRLVQAVTQATDADFKALTKTIIQNRLPYFIALPDRETLFCWEKSRTCLLPVIRMQHDKSISDVVKPG